MSVTIYNIRGNETSCGSKGKNKLDGQFCICYFKMCGKLLFVMVLTLLNQITQKKSIKISSKWI